MKNARRLFLILLVGASSIGNVNAQDLEGTLRAGPQDAQTYMQNYMEPAILSFANGLANGWVNTAKTHKILGLDLTFSLNLATVPDEALTFAYSAYSWQNLKLASGSDGNLPTLVGGSTDNQLFMEVGATITDPSTGNSVTYTSETGNFDAAEGIDISRIPFAGVPTPTLQLGIGLMKNTDLKIRYVPTISTDDIEFSMFGIGVMHDIKQWIPGLKLVPIDIAGFFGTTSMNAKIEYEIEQPELSPGVPDPDEVFYTDGSGSTEFKVSSTTIQILASKKLSFFTPYVAVGYNIVSSSLDVKGKYIYTNDLGVPLEITDPVSLEFGGGSSPRATIGAQLKLLVLTIHADYTLQKYNTFTAGIGISIR